MVTKTSEEALSALERSTLPAIDLLDQAAKIIDLHLKPQPPTTVEQQTWTSSSADPLRFRHQWLLRWLTKQLVQANKTSSQESESRDSLIYDCRTWVLLLQLLSEIPARASKDILLERNFCQILCHCLDKVRAQQRSNQIDGNNAVGHTDRDIETGRAKKKRKLSSESETPGSAPTELVNIVLQVSSKTARILGGLAEHEVEGPRVATVKWIANEEAAILFLAQIIKFADFLLEYAQAEGDSMSRPPTEADVLANVDLWLQLWQQNKFSLTRKTKRDPHVVFNEDLMMPALRLCRRITDKKHPAVKELERQVALHTVLPSRAAFNTYFAKSKTMPTQDLPDRDVQQVLQTIAQPWGVAVSEFRSLPDQASHLLSIAHRLIPRSDIARRKTEASWLEALWLCLSHLVYLPSLEDGSNQEEWAFFSRSYDFVTAFTTSPGICEPLIDALEQAVDRPVSAFWHFFVRQCLTVEGVSLSTSTLARIVKQNPSLFVPRPQSEDTTLLQGICSHFRDDEHPTKHQCHVYISEILKPILHETGKSRRVEAFAAIWESRLVETFYDRTQQPDSSSSGLLASHVWDDPDLLAAFTTVCRSHVPLSTFKEKCERIVRDLEALSSITGAAHDVFARLTTFMSMVQGILTDPVASTSLQHYVGNIITNTLKALQRSSDYQGQRWQLWKILCIVQSAGLVPELESSLREHGVMLPIVAASDGVTTKAIAKPTPANLLEQYWSFCIAMKTSETDRGLDSTIFDKLMQQVLQLLQFCITDDTAPKTTTLAWDGSVEDMQSPGKLLGAYLAKLATIPPPEPMLNSNTIRPVLVGVAGLSCLSKRLPEDLYPSLSPPISGVCEALIATLSLSTEVDFLELFLDAVTQYDIPARIQRLSPLLSHIQSHRPRKGQGDKFMDMLLGDFQHSPTMNTFLGIQEYLVVLKIIFSDASDLANVDGLIQPLLQSLAKPAGSLSSEQLVAMSQHVERFTGSLIERLLSTHHEDTVAEILRSDRKKLKKGAPHKTGILDSYDDFFTLSLMGLLTTIKKRCGSKKLVKEALKLEEQFLKDIDEKVRQYARDHNDLSATAKVLILGEVVQKLCLDSQKEGSGALRAVDIAKALCNMATSEHSNEMQALSADFHVLSLFNAFQTKFGGPDLDKDKGFKLGDQEVLPKLASQANAMEFEIRLAAKVVERLSPTEEHDLIAGALAGRVQGTDFVQEKEVSRLFATASLIRSLKLTETPRIVELHQILGSLASLRYEHESSNLASLLLRLDISKAILERYPGIVNQDIIDNTLGSIAVLASSASKVIPTNDPSSPKAQHIFDRLCAILLIVLVRYRRRLMDRHHLLLPALQNLLRCLFYPASREYLSLSSEGYSSRLAFLASLPHWLNPPSYTSTLTLPPASAAKFSRLLQTLCDPSVSAARNVLKRSYRNAETHADSANGSFNLTDETKQLKREVSLHTQYLVQTFCQVSLDGQIAPDVREKLLPGLYVVISAMDIELMRAFNAAMNENQRAIWKDLYADWNRFGKWNQR